MARNEKLHEKQNIDLALLKDDVRDLKKWAENADKNHFPSIERRFNRIETRLAGWGGGIAVLVILIPMLLKLFFK